MPQAEPSSARSTAIVVLGCRVEPCGGPSAALRRRAEWAAAAYEAGLADRVIASGGRRWGEHVEAVVVKRYLVGRGVPADRVYLELSSLTTAENALFSGRLLGRLGDARALVVTCAWHMPRALACFAHVGVEAAPLPAPSPPATAGQAVRRALHEALSRRIDAWNLGRIARLRAAGLGHPFDEPTWSELGS